MRTLLAIAACVLTLGSSTWAEQAQAPNTAAKAAEAALAFFPHSPSGKVPQSAFGTPFQDFGDVTEPAAAVQRQYRLGLDSLQAGKSAPYLALLAQVYQQSGADKAETARRLADLLASNRCNFCQILHH